MSAHVNALRIRELKLLAHDHLQWDLQESDRVAMQRAIRKSQDHAKISTILGLGLGLFFAFLSRRSRMQRFTAFRTREQATHVVFADGTIGESEPAG